MNRGATRQATHALWCIALWRLGAHPRTKTYVARRSTEGKTKREIMRCLTTYIAREPYKLLPERPT